MEYFNAINSLVQISWEKGRKAVPSLAQLVSEWKLLENGTDHISTLAGESL